MTAAVAVQNPTLVADSISAGTVTATAAVAGTATVTELTAASAKVQQDLQVNGTLNGTLNGAGATFQKVTIDTVCQVPYVNAVNGSFSSGISVGGPVSLLGMAQQLSPKPHTGTTYTASTDGLVLGFVSPGVVSGFISVRCGALDLFARWDDTVGGTSNSFLLPVRRNETFTLYAGQGVGMFYFIPLGSGLAEGALVEQVGEGVPGAEPPFDPVGRGIQARSELVAALTEAFGPVSDEVHQRLLLALERMG